MYDLVRKICVSSMQSHLRVCMWIFLRIRVYLRKRARVALSGRLMPLLVVWMGEGIVWSAVGRQLALEWEVLQMWSIYSSVFVGSEASFESSCRYRREKQFIWPWLMFPALLVIHPVLQASWEKQVVPQLVNYWREKKSLLFGSSSQPDELLPLFLAQVNGKRRGNAHGACHSCYCCWSLLSWFFFFFACF